MHKLTYRYWCYKKGQFSHGCIEGSIEDIEEFLTHTELEVLSSKIDGVPIEQWQPENA